MRTGRSFLVVVVMMLAACGSGGDGTRPSISATLPPAGGATSAPPEATQPGVPAETQAPAATPPPETAPPATAPPTAAPAPAPADTATDTTVPATGDDDGTVWWPWVLGALVVVGIIAAIAARRRRGPTWKLQATAMLDEVDQLTGHLAALTPEGLRAVALADATTLARLRATLATLTNSAPDTAQRAAMNSLVAPMADLHGAVDAAALGTGLTPPMGGLSVAQFATRLHTASTSARAALTAQR